MASDSTMKMPAGERLIRGDRDQVGQVFEELRPAARRKANRLLVDKNDASDLAQEGLLKAYLHLEQFRGNSFAEFRALLWQIISNLAKDLRRRNGAKKRQAHRVPLAIAGQVPDQGPSPNESLSRAEEKDRLAVALGTLPEREQELIYLRYFQVGWTDDCLAERFGVTPRTIASWLHNARVALKIALTVGDNK